MEICEEVITFSRSKSGWKNLKEDSSIPSKIGVKLSSSRGSWLKSIKKYAKER